MPTATATTRSGRTERPNRRRTSTVDVDPNVIESNLLFLETGANGKIDIADSTSGKAESNDLYIDVEGYFYRPASGHAFDTPQYYPTVVGDTFYNTTGTTGDVIATANDTLGVNNSCRGTGTTNIGSDIAILQASGADPSRLNVTTVNCMKSFGPRAGGTNPGPDGCSWKTGGITRIGQVIYLAVARQIHRCDADQSVGLQGSFNASIMKSTDGGLTWTNPWGTTSATGAAPPYNKKLGRYQAMFPGQNFSAPFFIQYGPGNTQTVDGANKYLYAVSNDGYAYNGNYLHLARVPLNKVQTASAWQYYHGRAGGNGLEWTSSVAGATRVLQAKHFVSQPVVQYVPALKKYVLLSFSYIRGDSTFPNPQENPYSEFRFFTSPKPWGPWTVAFDHTTQRSLWCTTAPCQLTQDPDSTSLDRGAPDDWMGLYDPSLVQKFVFTRPLANQAVFTNGDWEKQTQFPNEALYRLHAIPTNLGTVLGGASTSGTRPDGNTLPAVTSLVGAAAGAAVCLAATPYLARLTLTVPDRENARWYVGAKPDGRRIDLDRAGRARPRRRSPARPRAGRRCSPRSSASPLTGSALMVIDYEHHRLPNRLVYPAAIGAFALLALAAAIDGDWSDYLRAVEGGAAAYVALFVLKFISPRSFGWGDVRLGGVLGAYLGYHSWLAVYYGIVRRIPARRARRDRADRASARVEEDRDRVRPDAAGRRPHRARLRPDAVPRKVSPWPQSAMRNRPPSSCSARPATWPSAWCCRRSTGSGRKGCCRRSGS